MVLVSSSEISITGKYYIVLLLFPEFSHFDFYFLYVKSPYSNHYLTSTCDSHDPGNIRSEEQ